MGFIDEDVIEQTQTAQTVPVKKPYNVYSSMVDVFTQDIERAKQAAANKKVNPLLRYGGAALEAVQPIVDVPAEAIMGGVKTIGENLGIAEPIKKGITSILESKPVQAYQGAVSDVMKDRPNLQAADRAALTLASILPTVGPIARTAGKGLTWAGKGALKGEMKINKDIARKAAPTIREGRNKIVSDIEGFNLESPMGGFEGVAEKTQKAIDERMNISEKELARITVENPDKTITLDGNIAKLKEEIMAGQVKGIPFDNVDDALEIVDGLADKIKKRLGKNVDEPAVLSFYEADKARKLFNEGVWKKGAFADVKTSLTDRAKEELALKMRDALGEYIPAQKAANREIRDLINIRDAANEALTRIETHNPVFNAGNLIAGGLGGALGSSTGEISGGMLGAIGAKNLLQKGRGASALIKGGRALQKTPKLSDIIFKPKTISEILTGVE